MYIYIYIYKYTPRTAQKYVCILIHIHIYIYICKHKSLQMIFFGRTLAPLQDVEMVKQLVQLGASTEKLLDQWEEMRQMAGKLSGLAPVVAGC